MALRLLGHVELPANRSSGGFDHADIHPPTDRLYVAHTSNDSIDVIDCARDRYVKSMSGLTAVAGALVSEARGLVFTSNRGENTVSVFAPGAERDAFKVGVGVKPNGLAFDASSRHPDSGQRWRRLASQIHIRCRLWISRAGSASPRSKSPAGRAGPSMIRRERRSSSTSHRQRASLPLMPVTQPRYRRRSRCRQRGRTGWTSIQRPAGCSAPATPVYWSPLTAGQAAFSVTFRSAGFQM